MTAIRAVEVEAREMIVAYRHHVKTIFDELDGFIESMLTIPSIEGEDAVACYHRITAETKRCAEQSN